MSQMRKKGGHEQFEESHIDFGELTAAAVRGGQNLLEAKQTETIAEGSPCAEGCSNEMPTGASNHLVTRKGPAVAGERPSCNEVGLRTPTENSGCQVLTGEGARFLQCLCCARSGCQVSTGEVAGCKVPAGEVTGALQRAFCERSGCQVPSG